MVNTVGKATPTSSRAGMTVQPISSLVLPWTWTGSGRPGRWRCLMTVATIRPWTRKKTTVATPNTGKKRLSILWAIGPSGLSVSCGAWLAQLARNTKTAGIAATLRRRTRPPSPRRIPTSRRLAAALYPGAPTKMETLGGFTRLPPIQSPSESEAVEGVGAALPVLLYFHVGFEVNFCAQEGLQLDPGRRPRVPDHC